MFYANSLKFCIYSNHKKAVKKKWQTWNCLDNVTMTMLDGKEFRI